MNNTQYMNAVTMDLIKYLDFIPLRDKYNRFIMPDKTMVLEKRDYGRYYIMGIVDFDVADIQVFKKNIENIMSLFYSIKENYGTDLRFCMIFIYTTQPRLDKTGFLEYLKNSREIPLASFHTVDVLNGRVDGYFSQYPANAVNEILTRKLGESGEGYNKLPDIDSIIDIQQEEDDIIQVQINSPATYIFMSVNIAMWIAGYIIELISGVNYINLFGIKISPLISQGQYWRLITPIFLHGDLAHLAANSFSLLIFGQVTERIIGTKKFLVIYLLGGIAGNITSFAFTRNPSLGASGAVLAVAGALVYIWNSNRKAFSYRRRQYLTLIFLAFFNIFYGFTHEGIDNFAHLGGAFGGYFLTGSFYISGLGKKVFFKAIFIIINIICFLLGYMRYVS